jgi:PKD repeat protein
MKKLLLSAAFLVSIMGASAQQNVCGTDGHYKHSAEVSPELAAQRAQFNAAFKEAMKSYNPEDYKVKGFKKNSAPKYIIPVVVHVFHQNGSENISEAQILSEISQLNKSFRMLNNDTTNIRPVFKDIAADAQIEFRLAKKDPDGNCTNGIVRVYTPLTTKGNDELKKLSVWDTKRYFNMWVVSAINKGPGVGVAGYAQFPFATGGGVGSSSTDGIMVIHNEFGNVGTSSPGQTPNVTTSTHEAGHWFGLYHPFQGDSCDNEGDGIQETPTTYFAPSTTEPLRNRCNIVPDYNSCSTDNPDLPDMMENFMDYFIGPCASNMFTLQQVARMHFCLENYRRELWQPENLVFTGVADGFTCTPKPIASFNMSTPGKTVCVGSNVTFRDNSYNASVNSWSWNFGAGASPATSTTATTTVTYSTSGWKTVTLTSTGPNGSGTTTVSNYIYVQAPSTYRSLPNGFEYADWDYLNDYEKNGWYFENEQPATWTPVTTAKVNGNRSLLLPTSTLEYGFTYSLISPTYNLTGATAPFISYSYAFAANYLSGANTNDSRDALQLFVSYDCGKSWQQKKATGGNAFSPGTANPLTTAGAPVQSSLRFTPVSPSQWRLDGISGTAVGSGANLASVKFKLSFSYQGGNNFYIDNLVIGTKNTGINDITAKDIEFAVIPNPFQSSATIQYDLVNESDVIIKLYDLVGKEIATLQEGKGLSGSQSVTISKEELGLNSGLYFVKTKINYSTKYR